MNDKNSVFNKLTHGGVGALLIVSSVVLILVYFLFQTVMEDVVMQSLFLLLLLALIVLVVVAVYVFVRTTIAMKIKALNLIMNQAETDADGYSKLYGDPEVGVLVESFQNISHQLHRRIEMEQLIAELSRNLASSPGETFTETMVESLGKLGSYTRSDRLFLLLLNDNRNRFETVLQWEAEGIPVREFPEDVEINQFAWLVEKLRECGTVTLRSIDEIPPGAEQERVFWVTSSGETSALVFQAVIIKGELAGFLGCELLQETTSWSASDIQLLAMFAEVAASSVDRFRTDRLIKFQTQQLIQAQKMETVGQLAGGIAHDFNNILAGIVSTTSVFRMEHGEDDLIPNKELLPFLDTVQEAGSRAAKMVQQLLLLSRKQEYNFAPIDLNRIIRQSAEMAATSFEKTVELSLNLCEEKAVTKVDHIQIEQVLLNFIMNAVHAMTVMRHPDEPRGGKLTITSERILVDKAFRRAHPVAFELAYFKITISDTGVGIPRDNYSKIFDPFFTTKDKGVGTGLGLSMIYRIIQEHYGFVEFQSEVGVGTTFHIYLPDENLELEEASAEVTIPVPAESHVQKRATIMVVDDEPVLRKIAGRILESAGHTVIFAEDGGEAVEFFRANSNSIDAVVLDLVMPVMGGRETYMELVKIKPGIPVIVSSGFRKDERVDELFELGVVGFLQKPYTVEQMKEAIQKVLMKL